MKEFICEICSKKFRQYAYQRKGKHIYCSRQCSGKAKKIFMKGIQPKHKIGGWNKGKKVWWSGEKHPNFKGRVKHTLGYINIYSPDHPHRDKNNSYVLEHRLVMEKHLGRYLTVDESIHHINRNKTDNRIENLQLVSKTEHALIHNKTRVRDSHNRFLKAVPPP